MASKEPESLLDISRDLCEAVCGLEFGAPVAFVYNPLEYAWAAHAAYVSRYGAGCKAVLFVGMNPGPWGMMQTGVPFGEVTMVRDWMGIDAPVGQPPQVHPARPVLGLGCRRSEVSGARLWGWARDRFGTPGRFFARHFVHNYCPLGFIEASGRNFTPDRLPRTEQKPLFAACDGALRQLAGALQPAHAVGVGRFAEQRCRAALQGTGIAVSAIPHPSPASPAANRGWAGAAEAALHAAGIALDTA